MSWLTKQVMHSELRISPFAPIHDQLKAEICRSVIAWRNKIGTANEHIFS